MTTRSQYGDLALQNDVRCRAITYNPDGEIQARKCRGYTSWLSIRCPKAAQIEVDERAPNLLTIVCIGLHTHNRDVIGFSTV
eukprot:3082159-Pyramimonas_sp.AAC.1